LVAALLSPGGDCPETATAQMRTTKKAAVAFLYITVIVSPERDLIFAVIDDP
jgi:hypothetical protein